MLFFLCWFCTRGLCYGDTGRNLLHVFMMYSCKFSGLLLFFSGLAVQNFFLVDGAVTIED